MDEKAAKWRFQNGGGAARRKRRNNKARRSRLQGVGVIYFARRIMSTKIFERNGLNQRQRSQMLVGWDQKERKGGDTGGRLSEGKFKKGSEGPGG